MSFLSNINLGGTTTQTTAFGGSTSFDFGGIGNAAVQGGTQGGSFDSGDAANAALDAAASAIPFGAMAKKFLDNLGLQENIDNLMKYGLSSWGASQSPEKIKGEFGKKIYPWFQAELESITAQNFEQKLNTLEDLLRSNHYYMIALRDHHSKAKSSRLAYDWAAKEYKKMLDQTTAGLIKEFEKHGVKVKKTPSNEHPRQMDIRELRSGAIFDQARDLDKYLAKQYYDYKVDYSGIKNLEVDENGNVKKKSSGLGLMAALGGIGYAIKSGAIKF